MQQLLVVVLLLCPVDVVAFLCSRLVVFEGCVLMAYAFYSASCCEKCFLRPLADFHCIFVLCTLSCEVLQSLSLVVFSRMCIHGVVLLSFRCGEGPSFQNRSFLRSPFLQYRRTVSGSRMLQIRGLSVVFFSFLLFFFL